MVLIASDNPKLIHRWNRALRRKYQLHFVNQKTALLQTLRDIKPRVLLVDAALPRLRIIRELPAIQSLSPATQILVLSASPETREGISALKAGAKGYADQNISSVQVFKAVTALMRDELWAGRRLLAQLIADVNANHRRKLSPPNLTGRFQILTSRKRQVALYVIDGATNKEIASRIGVTEAAIKAHLTGIFRQLNVSGRRELARLFDGSLSGASPQAQLKSYET